MSEADFSPYDIAGTLMSTATVCAVIILLRLILTNTYRYEVEMAGDHRILGMDIVTKTTRKDGHVVVSVSEYCAVRGATTQSTLTAFCNVYASIGLTIGLVKFYDGTKSERLANILFVISCLGCYALGNFEVNNQTSGGKCIRATKEWLHVLGAGVFVIAAPLSYVFLVEDVLSFLLAVVAIGTLCLYWLFRSCTESLGFHEDSGDCRPSWWPKCFARETVNEQKRHRTSVFFMTVEMVSVITAGVASILTVFGFGEVTSL